MSKEGWKKEKKKKKPVVFIKQKRNTLTGVYSPETFFASVTTKQSYF